MKVLYYVRHGATPDNLDNRWCGGGNDIGLHPIGHEQAMSAARKIVTNDIKFDVIISSPRLRAKQTAEPIADAAGYPRDQIIISDLFNERDFGSLEGQSHEDELVKAYYDDETAVDGYDGEDFALFHERADQALEYVRGLDYKAGLVVAHATLNRALERHLYQLPVQAPWPSSLGNGEVRKYDLTIPTISVKDKKTIDFGDPLCSAIYAHHLHVRQWQVDNNNHVFSNFLNLEKICLGLGSITLNQEATFL